MQIQLAQSVPTEDGYYLVKFSSRSGLHLVMIQTDLGGQRDIYAEGNKKLFIHDFPLGAYWSEKLSCVI